MPKELPSQEELLKLFHYDKDTGQITNLLTGHIYRPTKSTNYIKVYSRPQKSYFMAHRVIWKMVNGELSTDVQLDHIDLNKFNNCISNLRLADKYQNGYNQAPRKNTVTGYRGVTYDKQRRSFKARIKVRGHRKVLGWFKTAYEARLAYIEASKKFHGAFGRY